ncbi:hypothetical protein QBC36DRAFT_327699 [Triangularia setosa]|uniref:Uncharacterized protein n=1 Tax=Triangularia setosa TaxID=2587417 RepID=A0AAN7A8J8_9PEZI|nr:hypothetical protein QBC36DRAFT_327699 [Podospora setosa]
MDALMTGRFPSMPCHSRQSMLEAKSNSFAHEVGHIIGSRHEKAPEWRERPSLTYGNRNPDSVMRYPDPDVIKDDSWSKVKVTGQDLMEVTDLYLDTRSFFTDQYGCAWPVVNIAQASLDTLIVDARTRDSTSWRPFFRHFYFLPVVSETIDPWIPSSKGSGFGWSRLEICILSCFVHRRCFGVSCVNGVW